MAYIKERGGFWRTEVRRKGPKPVYRTFDTQKQAQQWARRIEAEIDVGTHIDRSEDDGTCLENRSGPHIHIDVLCVALAALPANDAFAGIKIVALDRQLGEGIVSCFSTSLAGTLGTRYSSVALRLACSELTARGLLMMKA